MSIIQGTSKGSGAVYEIDQSIRFNDNDSAYLSRTPGSAGNRRTFTFSCWVKRANLTGANQPIFTGSGNSWIMFLSAETFGINFDGSNNYRIVTTQLFRDPGAWMHVVLRVDTTNSTANDRLRMYINGSQATSFSTRTNPTLNADTDFNNTGEHNIGKLVGASQYFDGLLGEINHVDGTSLGPDSFGETNTSGVWIPKAYSGSYGTNGFYSTGATAGDLGEDFSGNNNDFTSSGLTAADQMLDTPTLNYCVMNFLDNGRPSNVTLSDGNLTCAFTGGGYQGGIRSSFFFDSEDSEGWYAECTLDSLAFASIFRAGVANAAINLASTDAQSNANAWAYSDQGAKLNNSYSTSYGSAVTATDVVGIAVRNGKIYFAINNTWQGSANPVTEANAAFTNLTGDVAFCQSTNTGGSYAHTATWNFGQSGFAYTPPTGYKALNTATTASPSISDPSLYFQSTLYEGDGSTQSINQAGNSTFQPDFAWIKNRDAADAHALFDAVRGATKVLSSNATTAEDTNADTLTAFESDGFALGDDVIVNTNNESYVAWQWKETATAGFDIVTYTGNGANRTISHGLGVAPSFVIVKSRNDTHDWYAWTPALSGTEFLVLNTTAAKGTSSPEVWNSTVPTSSVVSIGTSIGVNRNTYNYVMYCFAEIPGYSSVGSYTGNGNASGPFIYTNGMKPAFILIKSVGVEEWSMTDSTRDPTNRTTTRNLVAHAVTAEADPTTRAIDYLSNGFKIRHTNSAHNSSGVVYIYMAFGSPFGGDGVAPATAR